MPNMVSNANNRIFNQRIEDLTLDELIERYNRNIPYDVRVQWCAHQMNVWQQERNQPPQHEPMEEFTFEEMLAMQEA